MENETREKRLGRFGSFGNLYRVLLATSESMSTDADAREIYLVNGTLTGKPTLGAPCGMIDGCMTKMDCAKLAGELINWPY